MKVDNQHYIRKVDPETGAVTIVLENRQIETQDIENRPAMEAAQKAEDARRAALKANVVSLKDHHDPTIAALAQALHELLP